MEDSPASQPNTPDNEPVKTGKRNKLSLGRKIVLVAGAITGGALAGAAHEPGEKLSVGTETPTPTTAEPATPVESDTPATGAESESPQVTVSDEAVVIERTESDTSETTQVTVSDQATVIERTETGGESESPQVTVSDEAVVIERDDTNPEPSSEQPVVPGHEYRQNPDGTTQQEGQPIIIPANPEPEPNSPPPPAP